MASKLLKGEVLGKVSFGLKLIHACRTGLWSGFGSNLGLGLL